MSNRKQSFDEFLKEEFERAAEEIQKEVEESGVEHMPDSLKQSMKAKLHEQIAEYENEKICAQLSEEDQRALELGRQMLREQEENANKVKVVRKKKRLRGYIVLAAALVLAMALGMTSMGDANRVISKMKSVIGDREVKQTDSDENNLVIAKEKEEEAYQKIEDVFGVEPIRIVEHPDGMMFQELVLDEALQTAEMIYKYNGKNVVYFINAAYADTSWGIDVEDKIIDQYYLDRKGCQIEITEYQVNDNGENHMSAKFSYQSLEYFLVGTMEKEEFEQIINFLHFFSK